MTDRPIIFSAPMVRAILEKRKTQTRRIVKDGKIRYALGDRLWVRESFNATFLPGIIYKADGGSAKAAGYLEEPKWKPSIHMPRWASRITLEVTGAKVERLQDISEDDAKAEGLQEFPCTGPHRGEGATFWSALGGEHGARTNPRSAFQALWEEINGDEAWLDNPWVTAITFKRVAA